MSEYTHPSFHTPSTGGGFDFDLVQRNAALQQQRQQQSPSSSTSSTAMKPHKTGTTIVGMVFENGVVLGADTRATNDAEVVEKESLKIHTIAAPNIYCCGAGTAADTMKTTELIESQLELLRMEANLPTGHVRVSTACTRLKRLLYRYQGHIGAALILGGCDPVGGPQVYQIHSHGSTSKLPYTTMGSGSLAAMAVFETAWRGENMKEEEAVQLVQKAIAAGILNDLGSGSYCDLCIIRMDGTTDYRRHSPLNNYNWVPGMNTSVAPLRQAIQRSPRLTIGMGVTPVLHSTYQAHPKASLKDVIITEMEVET